MRVLLNAHTGEITEAPLEGDEEPAALELESLARLKRAVADGSLDIASIVPETIFDDVPEPLHDAHVREWEAHTDGKHETQGR